MTSAKQKPVLQLYNKLCEVVSLIGDLVSMESLTDMVILQVKCLSLSMLLSALYELFSNLLLYARNNLLLLLYFK